MKGDKQSFEGGERGMWGKCSRQSKQQVQRPKGREAKGTGEKVVGDKDRKVRRMPIV